MTNQIQKIEKALKLHNERLNKELSYSEDLQNKEEIAHIRSNIEKVQALLGN